MKNKKERKERKNVHRSPLQKKNEPRSQGFFLREKTRRRGRRKTLGRMGTTVDTVTSGVVWVDNR